MTVTEARKLGATWLASNPEQKNRNLEDATLLLMHVLQCARAEILARPERVLLAEEERHYRRVLEQRASGRPIQHITGVQEFWGLPFTVTPDVLIPRPETEHLVEAAIARMRDHSAPRIVDVGTGSGAIAVAITHALPQAQTTATDISEGALVIARQNAGQNRVAERVRWMHGDLLTDLLDEKFDAVVSNPPYVAESERATLASEVRDHEPPTALFAGPTGLEIYVRLIPQAERVLVPGGWLLLEIGHDQRPAIEQLLHGWQQIAFVHDLQGIARVACAQRP